MTDSAQRVERAVEEIRKGEMVILMDDSSRENEGDLCMAAEKVTPSAIAFMAKYGRGLICLAITEKKARELNLPLMVRDNRSRFGTNFTISIDAREGVTTGISAADRAKTILTAVSPDCRPEDLVSPGHIFPLQSASGGVLERAGQTEGSVDLAKLAGLSPAGVICEIMKDDGTMARRADLEIFARERNLVMLDIADIINYRLKRETLIEKVVERQVEVAIEGQKKEFKLVLFKSKIHDHPREYMALIYGKIDSSPTLCRVHVGHLGYDLFGIKGPRKQVTISEALKMIVAEGKGAFVFFPPKDSLSDEFNGKAVPRDEGGLPASQAVLREFGMGAQVLASIGLKNIKLITRSPKKLYGLEGFGLRVVENVSP